MDSRPHSCTENGGCAVIKNIGVCSVTLAVLYRNSLVFHQPDIPMKGVVFRAVGGVYADMANNVPTGNQLMKCGVMFASTYSSAFFVLVTRTLGLQVHLLSHSLDFFNP